MDLEALSVIRAEEQMTSGAWRVDTRDPWRPANRARCDTCGKTIASGEKQSGPSCAACKKAMRRAHCLACSEPPEVNGYCRRHWYQVRDSGVVDMLHIGTREGRGAPGGWGGVWSGRSASLAQKEPTK